MCKFCTNISNHYEEDGIKVYPDYDQKFKVYVKDGKDTIPQEFHCYVLEIDGIKQSVPPVIRKDESGFFEGLGFYEVDVKATAAFIDKIISDARN